jgi:hypothetical protein
LIKALCTISTQVILKRDIRPGISNKNDNSASKATKVNDNISVSIRSKKKQDNVGDFNGSKVQVT